MELVLASAATLDGNWPAVINAPPDSTPKPTFASHHWKSEPGVGCRAWSTSARRARVTEEQPARCQSGCRRLNSALFPQPKAHIMLIRPFAAPDGQPILDLTLATFEPFYEGSFRSLMGELIFAVQHGDWRKDYAEKVPFLHQPQAGKYVDVAEVDGALAGYVSWQVDLAREHGTITILAVAPVHRRDHVGRQLCEHAMARMKDLGARIVEIGTGGDAFHAPARALYENLGCIQIPVAVYFKEL